MTARCNSHQDVVIQKNGASAAAMLEPPVNHARRRRPRRRLPLQAANRALLQDEKRTRPGCELGGHARQQNRKTVPRPSRSPCCSCRRSNTQHRGRQSRRGLPVYLYHTPAAPKSVVIAVIPGIKTGIEFFHFFAPLLVY